MSAESGVVGTTFAQIPEWLLEADVSSRAIHLYAVLQGMAGKKGAAWPTRKTLAARTRCSPDTVDRAVDELVQADALRIEPRFSEDGDRTSNRYVVLSERPDLRRRGRMDAQTGGGTSAQAENQTQSEPDPQEHSLTLVRSCQDSDTSFSAFWESYPRRNGKRLGKPEAENAWKRMSRGDRAAAMTGVKHYAQAIEDGVTIAKDAHRWLRGRCWVDWQEPAETETTRRPSDVPDDAVCIDGTWVY
jgi:DNA-binding transcriptional MocR family regulator